MELVGGLQPDKEMADGSLALGHTVHDFFPKNLQGSGVNCRAVGQNHGTQVL